MSEAVTREPDERCRVSVIYCLPERQYVVDIALPAGTTVVEAAQASGLLAKAQPLPAAGPAFGIFGRVVTADRPVADGDRIEILRPLRNDPREKRRRLAACGRTMGKARP
jgi:uncharacterized protein